MTRKNDKSDGMKADVETEGLCSNENKERENKEKKINEYTFEK